MQTDLIILKEYCNKCEIEPSFVLTLREEGLIEIEEDENEQYLLLSQLKDLERYSRLYYDLSINVEGIDTIRHLLHRMNILQDEISILRKKLNFYK